MELDPALPRISCTVGNVTEPREHLGQRSLKFATRKRATGCFRPQRFQPTSGILRCDREENPSASGSLENDVPPACPLRRARVWRPQRDTARQLSCLFCWWTRCSHGAGPDEVPRPSRLSGHWRGLDPPPMSQYTERGQQCPRSAAPRAWVHVCRPSYKRVVSATESRARVREKGTEKPCRTQKEAGPTTEPRRRLSEATCEAWREPPRLGAPQTPGTSDSTLSTVGRRTAG